MPRVSREQADNNRLAITDASARLFRERGIDNVSVAELMAAAGLTHGGFYGHFESKDQLAAEACRWAFGRSVERWKKRIAEKSDRTLARAALTDNYLSAQSRNNPGASCPAAAFAGDVARE
jgi:TetR/AcrR family transcriptional repressor of nem operon